MNSFGQFRAFNACALGLFVLSALISSDHTLAATFQSQSSNPIETPDPYFKSPLQPIQVPANPPEISRSYNFQPAAVPAQPNSVQPLTTPAPTRVASNPWVAPTSKPSTGPNLTKPIKGPIELPPIQAADIWNAPNTPVTAPTQISQPRPPTPPGVLKPNFNNFSAAPVPAQNAVGSATRTPIAPSGTVHSVSPVAAPLAPKSIIREQQPNQFQLKQQPPSQALPIKSQPVQPIQNPLQQSFQSSQNSFKASQPGNNDFVPGSSTTQKIQTPVTKTKTAKLTQPAKETLATKTEKVNQASTIATKLAPVEIESPSQQLVKQVGFVEPIANPIKQQQLPVTFEPGKVVAIVGGEPIFVGDMLFEINQIVERFIQKAPEEVKARERQKMIPQILPKFVDKKLLYHGMVRELPEGVEVSSVLSQASSEFDKKALPNLMESAGVESLTQFDAYLRSLGSSLRNMRESWAKEQMTRYFLSQKLRVNNEVTHQEMLDNYRQNLDSYAKIAKSRWEQIMVRFDRFDSKEKARAEITKLSSQIVHGANLAALAKKSSHGFLASDGGQQNWTSKGALVLKEIDEAIFTLPTGVLSDIIETKDGFHVVRVIERTEAGHTSFLDAQVEIKKKIIADKRKAVYDKHLDELRSQIPVEYLINDGAVANLIPDKKHR